MRKNILGVLTVCTLIVFSTCGFSVNPGAAQVQVKNTQKSIDQTKRYMKQSQQSLQRQHRTKASTKSRQKQLQQQQ